jgi:hypothetical protein
MRHIARDCGWERLVASGRRRDRGEARPLGDESETLVRLLASAYRSSASTWATAASAALRRSRRPSRDGRSSESCLPPNGVAASDLARRAGRATQKGVARRHESTALLIAESGADATACKIERLHSWAGLAAGRGRMKMSRDSISRCSFVHGRSRLFSCQATPWCRLERLSRPDRPNWGFCNHAFAQARRLARSDQKQKAALGVHRHNPAVAGTDRRERIWAEPSVGGSEDSVPELL